MGLNFATAPAMICHRSGGSRRRAWALWLPLLGIGSLMSCSNSSEPAGVRVFVGQVAENDARVGIVATAHHARLFLCGGPTSYSSATHWFSLDLTPSAQIAAEGGTTGSFSVAGHIGPTSAGGTLTLPDGSTLTFQASPVSTGSLSGLYEADAPCGKAGLIVAEATSQSPATGQGACIPPPTSGSPASPILQVTPVEPIARAADGSVRVSVDGQEIALIAAKAPTP